MPLPPVKRVVEFPPPYWSLHNNRLYLGDVRKCLAKLPNRSVHCVVTSPPYWGLRDYGVCMCTAYRPQQSERSASNLVGSGNVTYDGTPPDVDCSLCNGTGRTVSKSEQIGTESLPDCNTHGQAQCGNCFVCNMVGSFRELKRVLRDDGVFWLNLGDSYVSGSHIPSGNIVGIPWRVALALQADGWILRQDVVWAKPDPMPESVKDRCTKSHEYIFMLTKSDEYYFDRVSIARQGKSGDDANMHSVWYEPTRPGADSHFATFSKELITPCIKSSTSYYGCCKSCGKCWERVLTKSEPHETVGWRKTCGCRDDSVIPCTVLDPFIGSGTTIVTAINLGHYGIGIDVSKAYLDEHAIPRIAAAINGGSGVVRKPSKAVKLVRSRESMTVEGI